MLTICNHDPCRMDHVRPDCAGRHGIDPEWVPPGWRCDAGRHNHRIAEAAGRNGRAGGYDLDDTHRRQQHIDQEIVSEISIFHAAVEEVAPDHDSDHRICRNHNDDHTDLEADPGSCAEEGLCDHRFYHGGVCCLRRFYFGHLDAFHQRVDEQHTQL